MKKWITGCACFCMMLAPIVQMNVQATETVKKVAAISDVALSAQGTLKGRAVNGQGEPLNAAEVKVSRNNQVVATAITNEQGHFEVAGLSTGVYEMQAGQGRGSIRVWEGNVAPPTAKENVLIVSGLTSRAQSGLLVDPAQTVTLGLAVTGVVLGAVALSEGNETKIIYVSP